MASKESRMIITSSFHARNNLSALLALVRAGQEVVVTIRRAPVARIVPFDLSNRKDSHE